MTGTQADFDSVFQAIRADEQNGEFTRQGIDPLYTASATSRLVIIGQAPGRVAQETRIPWNDKSGDRLRDWLGIDRATFYDPSVVALLPMDFYYPGKGKSGDLPPRRGFAERWHPVLLGMMPQVRTPVLRNYGDYLPRFFPLVHPSPRNQLWMSRNPWFETDVLPRLRSEVASALRG